MINDLLSKETKKSLKKDPRLLSPEKKAAALAELEEAVAALDALDARNRAENPFWYYAPVSGEIVGERRAFLREFLKDEDIPQKLHGAIDVHQSLASIRGASGGNQCLGGEQEVFDPVACSFSRVEDIKGDFHVYSWDGQDLVIAKSLKPFVKDVDDIYEVTFSDGNQLHCSLSHLVLTPSGYQPISDDLLKSGVFLPPSTSESFPSIRAVNGLRFFETIQGFQCGCQPCSHFYDEQPRCEEDTFLSVFPSLSDAQKHRVQAFLHADGRVYKSFGSRVGQYGRLLANRGDLSLIEARFVDTGSDVVYTPCKSASDSHLVVHRSSSASSLLQSKPVSFPPANRSLISASLVPSLAVTNIRYLRRDVKWDFTVPGYHNYWAGGVINHNSSKTTTGCIEALIKATGSLPFCFDPTHKDFKFDYPAHRLERKGPQFVRVIGEDYQNGVLRNLIPTYRKWAPREHLIDGSWEKSYSSGEQTLRLIDPQTKALRGTIEFMSNKQDLGTFQGPPRHMLVFDEEPDHEVYKENLMRFTTASSLDVLFCMTPTKGLSWTYDLFTRGTDETGNNVDWFQIASVCNPHANIKVLREILKEMESYEELKMRLLGEFVSLSGLVYGKLFQHSLHVIPPFETGCTCGGSKEHTDSCPYSKYMGFLGIDPHMVKDSCAVMCFVDREDNFFVDTCYKRGVTVEEMKRDLTLLTQDHRIVKRVVDPSSDSSLTIHDNVNIFQLLKRGKFALPNLTKADKFQGSISAGISNIKERLKILERSKRPRFFIFDRPENKLLIKSFKTLQRETFADEEQKGRKDKIAEGLHDHHACVRYILQRRFSWRPSIIDTPDFGVPDEEMLVA